jgi:undecaprenyl pyrophosphate phosphatase UppP
LCSLGNNAGLCGVGLRECHGSRSAAKVGLAFGILIGIGALVACILLYWKRRANIARAQRLRKFLSSLVFGFILLFFLLFSTDLFTKFFIDTQLGVPILDLMLCGFIPLAVM